MISRLHTIQTVALCVIIIAAAVWAVGYFRTNDSIHITAESYRIGLGLRMHITNRSEFSLAEARVKVEWKTSSGKWHSDKQYYGEWKPGEKEDADHGADAQKTIITITSNQGRQRFIIYDMPFSSKTLAGRANSK